MSVETIRAGIAEALAGLGMRPAHEAETPTVTANALGAMVEIGPVVPVSFGDTAIDMTFRVIVLAGPPTDRSTRARLDTSVDPTGNTLWAALNGTLGNTVDFCTVSQSSEYREYNVGDASYLGCEFTVVIGT